MRHNLVITTIIATLFFASSLYADVVLHPTFRFSVAEKELQGNAQTAQFTGPGTYYAQALTWEEYKKKVGAKRVKAGEQGEQKDKAMDALIELLNRTGKSEDANWIREWYENGKKGTDESKGKIKFVQGNGNVYVPETNTMEIGENSILSVFDSSGEIDSTALSDLLGSLLHEYTHSREWLKKWGTTDAKEKAAYLGTHKQLADMWQTLTDQLAAQYGAPICDQAKTAKDIIGIAKAIGTNEIAIQEHSLEVKEIRQTEANKLESEIRKLRSNRGEVEQKSLRAWIRNDSLQKKALDKQLEDFDTEITDRKDKKEKFKQETFFDGSSFKWTDKNGKSYDRKQLMDTALYWVPNMEKIIRQCEESKKDFSELTDKEKEKLFGDLCSCSCGPSGATGGATYEAGKGCICSGVLGGQWPVPMISSGDCFKGATAAAGLKPGSADEPVKNINKAWAEYYIRMAKGLIEDIWTPLPGLSLGKTSKAGTPETLKERVDRKLSEGDIDKAEAYTKTAIEMYPPVESVAKAVITGLPWRLEKLALSFVPSLDFGTSRMILERTIKLDEKNQQVNKSLAQVVQWEKEWNQIKSLSEDCFSLIKSKRVCECQRLFDGKIEPLNNSFRIWTGGTYERGLEDGRTVKELAYLPIPEKDTLRWKLALELQNSRRGCRNQPGLVEPAGWLESYIANRERSGRTDQSIVDTAKKVLEREGLCDCERELAEKALGIADKWIAEWTAAQGPPLKVTLQATKTVMKKGESVDLTPTISGGSPPYNYSYMGWWACDVTGGAITGQGQTTTSLRPKITGAHPIDINVTDAKGQKASGRIVLNVIEDTASKPPGETTKPIKLDVSLMADKNMLKIGESSYITAAVTGGKPPYKIKWSGALSGEGTTILFKAKTPGSNNIFSDATDSMGNKGSANITINVGADKTKPKEPPKDNTKKKTPSIKVGKSKIIVVGSKPETSSSPLKLKVPQGEQSQTLIFSYEHKVIKTGKMQYMYPPPSATTFRIGPSNSGATITRISNPAKWGDQKLFAVSIDKDVKPGKKFTLTAYYIGIPLTPGATSKYLDTGEDAEEYLRKNIKPATAVIKVIGGKITSGKTDTGYDPTKDPNIKGSGKTVDTASVESAGKEFQDTKRGTKKADGKAADAQPTAQPDTYAGTGKTKEDTDAEQAQKPPYPPYYPPPDEKMGSGTDWTKWAQTPTKKPESKSSSGKQSGESKTSTDTSSGSTSSGSSSSGTSTTGGSTSSSGSSSGTSQGQYITAVLENKTDQNVHISADSSKLFGQYGDTTRLTPGQRREVLINIPPYKITFYAGRNGSIISSKSWDVDPDHLNRYPMVYFTKGMGGKEELVITTNLK